MARRPTLGFRFSDLRIRSQAGIPKHRQVYAGLRDAILAGQLHAGETLPSTRDLARRLGVSRNTVLTAYDLLAAEGYVTGRSGAGTFVAKEAVRPPPVARERVPPRALSAVAGVLRITRLTLAPTQARAFNPSSPAYDAFPYRTWSRILARLARAGGRGMMAEPDPAGFFPLRRAIARHLHAMRSCRCDPEQIVVVSGSQMGFALCSVLLAQLDEPVWFEDPGYVDARLVFAARSRLVVPVPLDEAGIDLRLGERISPRPRIIYVTPTHQWPSGLTMPVQRRLALLDFAARHDAWIVEDDYDGDLRYDGNAYAAIQSLDDAQRVVHVGSFSKTLYPGLRLGYVVVPPDLVDSFVAGRHVLDKFPNSLGQAAVAELMESGLYARHVHGMQSLYRERHQLLRTLLEARLGGALSVRPSTAGLFTVADLAPGFDDVALTEELGRRDVVAQPLSAAYAAAATRRGLILGHAVAPEDELRRGVETLERVVTAWLRRLERSPRR